MAKKSFGERFSTEPLLERFYMRFERLGIVKIFVLWITIVVLFGLVYMLVSRSYGTLASTIPGSTGTINSLLDSIYFSFITATSTGYGDIVPMGLSKVIAFVEVIVGLTIFALVTSKIVGIKQERILREIYEISLQEKVNRIRSSLFLYRSDVSQLMDKVEADQVRKRDLAELWTFANFIEQRLMEVKELFGKQGMSAGLDVIDGKLMMKSVNQSLAKTEELFAVLDEHKADWRREVTIFAFEEALGAAKEVMGLLQEQVEGSSGKEERDLFEGHRSRLSKMLRKQKGA